jgi:predicted RNA-binding Zn-ribbon protein involved in translation (DUF1610 family)
MSAIHGTGIVKYKCLNCGHEGDIPMPNLSFEEVETLERDMGPEIHHHAQWDFNCPKCNTEIELVFDVWEYPEGQINAKEKSAKGANILSSFDVDGFGVTLGDER